MTTTLDDFVASLPRAERARIKARTKVLIAEELSLRDIRRAVGTTQVKVAGRLKIGQHAVSRLESRTDMQVSSLQKYLRALGGELEMIARFPNMPAIRIDHVGSAVRPKRRAKRAAV